MDLYNNTKVSLALDNAVIATNTTTIGNSVDGSIGKTNLFITSIKWTDGSFAPVLYHADLADFSDEVAVTDADLIGTLAGAILTATGTSELEYIGGKQFRRVKVVSTGTTVGAVVSVLSLQGTLRHSPAS